MPDGRLVESWTWFAVASLVVVLRYISRSMRLGGWRYYQLEDFVMILVFAFYTNLIVWVNIQEHHPLTNILPSTGLSGISNAEIKDRIYGSKITFVIEESMVMIQFLTKLCMCLLYFKLTEGLKRQIWVKLLLGYLTMGWLITEIFYFGVWCRPFLDYFRVFVGNNIQCETAQHHLIMSFVFNLSSDVLMLLVPIPLLLQSKLPWKQKAIITGIFSLGIFVIISAILSRYYCFAKPDSILWIFWYVREASTIVIVANIPHLYPLFQQLFKLRKFGSLIKRTTKRSGYVKYPGASVELKQRTTENSDGKNGRSASTENFAKKPEPSLKIWQRSEYSVGDKSLTEEQWDETDAHNIWRGGIGTKSTVVSDARRDSKDSD